MSKSNEFIGMIGSGRSVLRILAPIFIIGTYSSLITLAFKYEWAPSSVGYSEALMEPNGAGRLENRNRHHPGCLGKERGVDACERSGSTDLVCWEGAFYSQRGDGRCCGLAIEG